MFDVFLDRWFAVHRHSRHLANFGATLKHGPSCKNDSPVRFSCDIGGFRNGSFALDGFRFFLCDVNNKEFRNFLLSVSNETRRNSLFSAIQAYAL